MTSESPGDQFFVGDSWRTALIVSASIEEARDVEATLAGLGIRSLGWVEPAQVMQRLSQIVALDLLFLDLRAQDWGEDIATLLKASARGPLIGDAAVVVETRRAFLDHLYGLMEDLRTPVLCDADAIERAAAISFALAPLNGPAMTVQDVGRESDMARLAKLIDEAGRLARTMSTAPRFDEKAGPADDARDGFADGFDGESPPRSRMHDRASHFRGEEPSPGGAEGRQPIMAQHVRAVLRIRRLREPLFPEGLFADPAWDMILDLLAARLDEKRVSVSSLCIAAAVPPTTALRWISKLTEMGIFERQADNDDGRRVFIALSQQTVDALYSFFDGARKITALMP